MASQSSSTHRSVVSAGVHLFTVDGHSLAAPNGASISSKPFWVGGHEWSILYYPDGSGTARDENTSVFLVLMNAGETEVTPSCSFSCLQQDPTSPATEEEKNKFSFTKPFSSKTSSLGRLVFMSKTDLAASGCLKDDCLVIKCTVELTTRELTYDVDQGGGTDVVVVPPSELTQQLGHLLESGDATDVTVEIGETKKVFKAHRYVLTARSPVFRAMLCGSMAESKESNICIEDMEAGVFEVLLHYMYHDDLPPVFMKKDVCTEEAENMAQHVLVAADQYGMDRLKLMCESMLSKTMMDVHTVCSTLGFADQHNCQQLKNCCLAYMLTDRERLKFIVKTEGFKELSQKCPSLASEVFLKSLETTPSDQCYKMSCNKFRSILALIKSCIMGQG